LRQVAHALTQGLRDSDLVGRVGGEEFAILLPASDEVGALLCAERLRQQVEALHVKQLAGGEPLRVTISVGLCLAESPTSQEQIYNQADAALYSAKHSGRNRVCSQSTASDS